MRKFVRSINVLLCQVFVFLLSLAFSYQSQAQVSHLPPVASMVQPANGSVFHAPATIQLIAKATSPNGIITNVSFYAGAGKLPGNVVQVVLDPPGVNGVTGLVYLLTWSNVPAGYYALTAVATDNAGISSTSAPVNITVLSAGPPPVVRITSPPNHADFYAPVNIPIFAFATAISSYADIDHSASISNVEFFAGTTDLGPGHRVVVPPPGLTLGPTLLRPNDFTLLWSNPPPGAYPLTAVATDDHGNTATSAPVNITVLPSHIITNGPDIVSIVASDPVAVAGTNCWAWPGLPGSVPAWADWKTPILIPITNCGPKDATFTVRRMGDASRDLLVFYAISGTASNGVDYVALPGAVTVPAGQNYALINIVPLGGVSPAAIETVVLTLESSPLASPPLNYIIGVPSRAAAIIIDKPLPRPVTGPLPGNYFHLNASGPDGAWFCVLSSSNMIDWIPCSTNQVVNGSIDFVDPNGMSGPNCFYQAVPQTAAPTQ